MFNLHGHQEKHPQYGGQATGADRAPGTELYFDPQLIADLKRDHSQQMQFIAVIRATAREGRFERTRTTLSQLRRHLQEHLIKEDLRVYTYLAYCLKDDTQRMPIMTSVRSGMAAIGRKLMRALQRYDESGIDEKNAGLFLKEFEEMLQLLAKRNGYEEGLLFPLYVRPSEMPGMQIPLAAI
jgi:hypothetical protein